MAQYKGGLSNRIVNDCQIVKGILESQVKENVQQNCINCATRGACSQNSQCFSETQRTWAKLNGA